VGQPKALCWALCDLLVWIVAIEMFPVNYLDYSSDECVAAIRAAAAKMREGGTGE
jgi:hypothetical protein